MQTSLLDFQHHMVRQFIDPAINDIQDIDERDQRLQEVVVLLARWMQTQCTEYGRLSKTTYPSHPPKNLPRVLVAMDAHSAASLMSRRKSRGRTHGRQKAKEDCWQGRVETQTLQFPVWQFQTQQRHYKTWWSKSTVNLLIMKVGETLHVLANVNDFGYYVLQLQHLPVG